MTFNSIFIQRIFSTSLVGMSGGGKSTILRLIAELSPDCWQTDAHKRLGNARDVPK